VEFQYLTHVQLHDKRLTHDNRCRRHKFAQHKFIESGQLGPFKNGYWDNPAYKCSPEADLMAVAHYLEALDLQKSMTSTHLNDKLNA
jgi:Ni,Fe-hydrogenase I large subunit